MLCYFYCCLQRSWDYRPELVSLTKSDHGTTLSTLHTFYKETETGLSTLTQGPLHDLLEDLNCFLLPDVYCSESTSPAINSCLGGVLSPDSDMWHKWSSSIKGGSICSDAKLAWYWRVSIRIHLVPLCPFFFMEKALKAISCHLPTSNLRTEIPQVQLSETIPCLHKSLPYSTPSPSSV